MTNIARFNPYPSEFRDHYISSTAEFYGLPFDVVARWFDLGYFPVVLIDGKTRIDVDALAAGPDLFEVQP